MPCARRPRPMLAPSRPAPTMRTGPVRRDSVTSVASCASALRSRRRLRLRRARCVSSWPSSTLVSVAQLARPAGCRGCSGPNCGAPGRRPGGRPRPACDARCGCGPECSVSSTMLCRSSSLLRAGCAPCRRRSGRRRARCRSVSCWMICGVTLPVDLGDVRLRDAERRVREHVREVAVVGEDEQPARLGVEPADVEQALLEVGRELREVGAALLVAASTRPRRAACSA